MPRILRSFLAACAAATVTGLTAAPVNAATTGNWRVAYTYRAAQGQVRSIAAINARDAWATGILSNSHGKLFTPFVLHWNGRKWRRVTVPGSAGYMMLSVSASSARDVWLFARRKTRAASTVFRWNGARWHRMTAPWDRAVVLGPRSAWSLTSVFCGLAGSGQTCGSRVQHWNGKRWKQEVVPGIITELAGTPGHSVWAAGTNAAGRLVAYRRSGGQWRAVALPHPKVATALGIATEPTRSVWIGVNSAGQKDYVLHWDGAAWRSTATVTASLAARAGTGLVVGGGGGSVWLSTWRWDGSRWGGTRHTAPAGLAFYQIAKVPGTARSYWAAAARHAGHLTHPAIGRYGPLP